MILLAYIAGSFVTILAVALGYILGAREDDVRRRVEKVRKAVTGHRDVNLSGPVKPLTIAEKNEKDVVVPMKNRMKRLFGSELDRPEQNVVDDIDVNV
jgi:hypothetical protein